MLDVDVDVENLKVINVSSVCKVTIHPMLVSYKGFGHPFGLFLEIFGNAKVLNLLHYLSGYPRA